MASLLELLGQTWPARMAQSAWGAAKLPGDVYAGRVDPLSEEGIGRATDLAGMVMGGTYAAAPRGAVGAGPIRAYHGSPYDFERFDISKIGTGEGAQAYGHGLYFAENPTVAESYKKALTGLNPNQLGSGKAQFGVKGEVMPSGISGHAALDTGQEMDLLLSTLQRNPQDSMIPYLKSKIENRIANHYTMKGEGSAGEDMRAMAAYYENYVKNAKPEDVSLIAPGKMYEVNIHADPAQFLDWDKPLAQQTEAVRSTFRPEALGLKPAGPVGEKGYFGYVDEQGRLIGSAQTGKLPSEPFNPNELGMSLYRGGGSWKPEEATARFREAGIPGIRYLDQGSRGGGAGTSNYVLFRDDIIDIVKKYGWAGLGLFGISAEDAKAAGVEEPTKTKTRIGNKTYEND